MLTIFSFVEKDFAGKMKPCLHGPNPPCQVKAQPKVPTGAIKPDNETVKVLANLETEQDCFKKTQLASLANFRLDRIPKLTLFDDIKLLKHKNLVFANRHLFHRTILLYTIVFFMWSAMCNDQR